VAVHATPGSTRAPSVWLIVSDKLGDNAQVDAIAEGLHWPYVVKRLQFQPRFIHGKPRFRATLDHVDLERSDRLEPPWPDLVLTVGRRPSMAALWVRRRSAGHSRVVIVGRPRRMLHEFALVLAPPQYPLPPRENVVHLDLPLMRIDRDAVERAADDWRARMSDLPRPLTAVLVGGPTKPFRFDAGVAEDLVRRLLRSTGGEGSVFVTTSRRTPPAVVDALAASLPPGARLFRWTSEGSDNPYKALLGLADRFVVTGDSVSMIVEVARLGKPLAILPLPVRRSPLDLCRRALASRFQPPATADQRRGLLARLGDAAYGLGLVGYSRDFSMLHGRLVDRGAAVFLGAPLPANRPGAPKDDLPRVIERVHALFSGTPLGAASQSEQEVTKRNVS
jgi:mitochondrial fission protein ELM1